MHFKFRHLQKIVGAFFLLTCVIVVVLLVTVARGQRWFQRYDHYNCSFTDGGGLTAGTSVLIHGLEAGLITKVSLDDENKVRFDVSIFKQYADRIRSKSEVRLVKPVIGSNYMSISLGPQEAPLIPRGGTIPSNEVESSDLDALIADTKELIDELKDSDGDVMQSFANINRATKDLSTMLSKKNGTVQMLLEKRELYDDLKTTISHLEHLLATVDESSPDIRDAIVEARRGVEEANKVILALQKSFLIRGNLEKYLKEDSTLQVEGRAK